MTASGLPFVLDVDPGRGPLVAQIVDAIVAAVRRGRLKPGDRLPGARTLARSLGVDRSTVDAAIDELEAQGVVVVALRSGARITADLPPRLAHRKCVRADRAGFDVVGGSDAADAADDEENTAGGIALWGGTPDVSLLPRAVLARALRTSLLGRHAEAHLGYVDAQGHRGLRQHIATLLRESRGVVASADDVLVTRGSQMALDLCARVLVAAGDVVACEDPGYPPARAAFLARGAFLAPISVDEDGFDVDEFERLLQTTKVRAALLTPHHQYPTTVTLSAPRRAKLLALCAAHRVVVIEDDYDHEFHYESRPQAPLLADDSAGVVVSVGTFSKILAPGLRTGWVTGPRDVVRALVRARRSVDRQGDPLFEDALATLLDDGEVARHARRMRRVYRARRDALVALVRAHLGHVVDFDVPRGGMALWLRVDPAVDVDVWIANARAQRVQLQPTSSLYLDGRARPRLRVGFAGNDERRLEEAVVRMARALPARTARTPRFRRRARRVL